MEVEAQLPNSTSEYGSVLPSVHFGLQQKHYLLYPHLDHVDAVERGSSSLEVRLGRGAEEALRGQDVAPALQEVEDRRGILQGHRVVHLREECE